MFDDGPDLSDLTPIEQRLLHVLLESSAGVWVSHEQMVRRVWGESYLPVGESEYHLLRTHVSRLRRKVKPAVIENNRDIGYRLTAA